MASYDSRGRQSTSASLKLKKFFFREGKLLQPLVGTIVFIYYLNKKKTLKKHTSIATAWAKHAIHLLNYCTSMPTSLA